MSGAEATVYEVYDGRRLVGKRHIDYLDAEKSAKRSCRNPNETREIWEHVYLHRRKLVATCLIDALDRKWIQLTNYGSTIV